jgi:pimeloyl-ACP methyl ester carboxylesterase
MTHLEEDWNNPGWRPYLSHLAKDFTVIRYDQRGNGMSDWDNVDISFDKMVDDLEAVIDCYDHEKIAIFGASQAAAVSIAYTIKYPERVSKLILFGGYPRGRCQRGDPESAAESGALVTLIRQSWGRDNPLIRQTMTSLFMPDATQEENSWFNEFQKTCGPGENIARFREMFDDINIVHMLGDVSVPTLVIHCVGDSVAPLSEGKLLASRIPGAKFVTLNSRNHMVFENDPEWPRLLNSVFNFLKSK